MFKEFNKFISSMDLAIILIAAISGLSISSTIFDTPEVFRSTPFRLLVGIFFINLLTCSLKLLPNVFRTLKRDGDFAEKKRESLHLSELTNEEVYTYLKDEHYHIKETEDKQYAIATKNKLAFLAPHVLHVGLLIIIVGSFLTTFQTTDTIKLSKGEEAPLPQAIAERVGKGTMKLNDFVTEYDEAGAVKNWISTFDLTIEGKASYKNEISKVNHPFKKDGLSIYQMAYSNEYLFHITGDKKLSGDYVFPEGQMIPLNTDKGEGIIQISPMAKDVALFYIFDGEGNQKKESALKAGDEFTLENGLHLTFEKNIDFTVLQVKYNPYLFVVFLGFIIASLASMMFWFGRYREIWLHFSEAGVYVGVVSKSRDVCDEVKKALKVSKEA